MTSVSEFPFELCTDAAEFRRLAAQWARERELWIDTETAEWQTSHPRISLLQVRTPDGRLYVVDVLPPAMREVLEAAFIPAVMGEPSIRKWAHNASYERRYLGGDRVRNLHCTLQLARSIPYHRLSVRKLTLAALASHLCATALDKTHQGDEWGVRPLTSEQLQYAAADPEWCYRVHQELESRIVRFDPAQEDPADVRDRYLTVNRRLRERKARRTDIRDAVRDHLLAESREALGGFRLHLRATARTTIGELVRVAAELDPGHTLAFDMQVPRVMSTALDPRGRDALRAACSIRTVQAFYGPRVPGREPMMIYLVAGTDGERIDREYAEIDDERRRLDSERDELRCRLKAWLEFSKRSEWEGFRIAESEERWWMDMRGLLDLVPGAASRELAVPAQFRLAFGGGVLDRLEATTRETPFVTWRERSTTRLDPEAPQSRDWHEAVVEEAP